MTAEAPEPPRDAAGVLREVAGYLNFSQGAPDPGFLRSVNVLFRAAESRRPGEAPLPVVVAWLRAALGDLKARDPAFADTQQAVEVLRLVVDEFRPAYREFHKDLLWGRTPAELWRPFFFGRVVEAVLSQGPPWSETERIVQDARDRLDDYLGYRPVATLESRQLEPYRHELVRPIPLYIEGVGVACGQYEELIERTLGVLRGVEPDLARDAWFDLSLMEELVLDPRAYDFDHPVNKRPNYHFGQWDPSRIDQRGYYRRFVLQAIALDAMLSRVNTAGGGVPRDELMDEAASVLAGTMLMASGTSGNGPGCHSSDVTLATLLPHIADYRDRFYEGLLRRAGGAYGERLRAEAQKLRQPFAGARQHLNQELARRRATQLQQVHLAQLFARMGYPQAAERQAQAVRVASARMLSQVYCRLTAGHSALDARRLEVVAQQLPGIEDLLHRGIECGALVDPWNVVGFGGNFSLFPALENSVHDYRVDDLIRLVEQVLDLCSRAWTEAASVDDAEHERVFSQTLERLADWWDQHATAAVSGVRRLVAKEIEISTNLVAGALNAWHKAGAAAGDVGFWRMFVDQFDTAKAFQLVIEALLDKGDLVSSMALMMQWASQSDLTPLEEGDASFYPLAERWLGMVEAREVETGADHWPTVAKFFEHLEASADEAWHVPEFELAAGWRTPDDHEVLDDLDPDDLDGPFQDSGYEAEDDAGEDDPDDELDNLFSAAYDDVVFHDSADDGGESAIYDTGDDPTQSEFEDEADRLEERLRFLTCVARLWKKSAVAWGAYKPATDARRATFAEWEKTATQRYGQLGVLLEAVHGHRVPAPGGSHEALVEYDRRRVVKDALLEQIMNTAVEVSDAGRLLRAAGGRTVEAPSELGRTIEVIRGVLSGNADAVRAHWPTLRDALARQELLYVPLGKGGDPGRIVKARALHRLLHDLAGWFPRLGLVRETCELMDVAQRMESEHAIGPGAVTEYDHLFEQGYHALVRCLVASADGWDTAHPDAAGRPSDAMLVEAVQDLTESQLDRWLRHSRTVRLSVVERLAEGADWSRFVDFVRRYGGDLFTQRFLSLANLRAILHQGVETWLIGLRDEEPEEPFRLLEELDAVISTRDAADQLRLAIEAVVENYREYRDYNSTTTQSDNGELLFAFVDFLRLRNAYDRIAWNLKPVMLAHEILVRRQRPEAAELWRREVAARTAGEADAFFKRLDRLCDKYGMRLPTIVERLSERFVRPLTIDRLRGLIQPAMAAVEGDAGEDNPDFASLEAELAALMDEPCGAGLDVPDWIAAVESEVSAVRRRRQRGATADEGAARLGQARLTWQELQQQLADEP